MKRDTRTGLSLGIIAVAAVAGWFVFRGDGPQRPPTQGAAAENPVTPVLNVSAGQVVAPPVTVETVAVPGPDAVVAVAPETPAVTPDAPAVSAMSEESVSANAGAPLAEARSLIAADRKAEARAVLTKAILAAPEGPEREEMHAMLAAINQVLFFSRAPSPDSEFYEVQRGDALSKIARRYGKDDYFADLIGKINGLPDASRIRVGQKLKVPTGEFSAVVQKHAHRLIILLNDAYIKEYTVGLGGAATPTPAATFTVANTKDVNPSWKGYKFGDPNNILGTRWIGFEDTAEYFGYGIHGTTMPETIGKDASSGCVRMLNSDVEEVFTMLMAGNTVKIVP
jgi:LysM repeat protein